MVGGGKYDDAFFPGKPENMLVWTFAAHENDTHNVQHLSGTHYLWVAQSCDEHGLVLRVGKDIAHHIG